TIRNLELIGSTNENATTLLDILDETSSPMGARLLTRWMVMPLKDLKSINERLHLVSHFYHHRDLRDELIRERKLVGELERRISMLGLQKASPRAVNQL